MDWIQRNVIEHRLVNTVLSDSGVNHEKLKHLINFILVVLLKRFYYIII